MNNILPILKRLCFLLKRSPQRNILFRFCKSIILFACLSSPLHAQFEKCEDLPHPLKREKRIKINDKLYNIPILAGDTEKISLKHFKNRALIINFWATWCAPCIREMPQLNRLAAFLKVNKIKVLTISEDRKPYSKLKAYLKDNKLYDLPVLLDPHSRLLKAFGLDSIPSTILITQNGTEIARVVGVAEWDSIELVTFLRQCLGSR